MKTRVLAFVLVFGLLLTPMSAIAEYPDRPVSVVNPFPAGGLSDLVARAIVAGVKKSFPKGIAVVNRPGAGGSIGMSEVIAATPDGYTLGHATLPSLVAQAQMNVLPYKTPDDYLPIINIVAYYSMLAVNADAPWKTASEFLSAVRANPGKLRVGSSGMGTTAHLDLEELVRLAKIKVAHVPFSGWAEGSAALLGKHVEALTVNPGEVRPLVDAKRIRILGAFAPARNAYYPDVPTFKELGHDAAVELWFLLIAPKGTPATVVQFIHDKAKASMEDPAFKNFVKSREIDIYYLGGESLREGVWDQYRKYTEILTRVGLLKK